MSTNGTGVGAQDAEVREAGVGFDTHSAWAKAREALEGAERKLVKQRAFLEAAEAEVMRLQELCGNLSAVLESEVGGDGMVGE